MSLMSEIQRQRFHELSWSTSVDFVRSVDQRATSKIKNESSNLYAQ